MNILDIMAAVAADNSRLSKERILNEMTSGDYVNLVEVFERELGEYFDIIVPDDWEE